MQPRRGGQWKKTYPGTECHEDSDRHCNGTTARATNRRTRSASWWSMRDTIVGEIPQSTPLGAGAGRGGWPGPGMAAGRHRNSTNDPAERRPGRNQAPPQPGAVVLPADDELLLFAPRMTIPGPARTIHGPVRLRNRPRIVVPAADRKPVSQTRAGKLGKRFKESQTFPVPSLKPVHASRTPARASAIENLTLPQVLLRLR